MFYLFPSICVFLCLVIVFLLIDKYNFASNLLNSPSTKRHLEKKGLVRIGGVVLSLFFLLILVLYDAFVFDKKTIIFFLGAFAFMIFGFFDDIKARSWKTQLFIQISILICISIGGITISYITNPLGGIIAFNTGFMYYVGVFLFIFWVLGIINVLNWSDGMHGIFAGVSFISSITIGILSLREDVFQPPIALMSFILAGALLGFLIVHLTRRKIIIGTSGTNFVGYLIAVLAIFAGAKIGTALLVLIVPIVDATFVLFHRFKCGVSVFSADTSHLHHRLLFAGWSENKILAVYYILTLIGSFLALLTQSLNKFIILALYGILLFGSFAVFTKVTHNFQKVDRN